MRNALIAMVICFCVSFGCKLPGSLSQVQQGNSDSQSPQNQNANWQTDADSERLNSDPQEELQASLRKFRESPHFIATMQGEGTRAISGRFEYATPDRYRYVATGGAGTGTEFIVVGKQTYMKAGGKWNRFPADIGSIIPSMSEMLDEGVLQSVRVLKREGDDLVDGVPATVYSYEGSTPTKSIKHKSRLWISKTTGLPLKVVVDYETGDLRRMTITYDMASPVDIEAPIQ